MDRDDTAVARHIPIEPSQALRRNDFAPVLFVHFVSPSKYLGKRGVGGDRLRIHRSERLGKTKNSSGAGRKTMSIYAVVISALVKVSSTKY